MMMCICRRKYPTGLTGPERKKHLESELRRRRAFDPEANTSLEELEALWEIKEQAFWLFRVLEDEGRDTPATRNLKEALDAYEKTVERTK